MNAVLSRLRALGADFTPDQIKATRELFAPLVPRPSDTGAQVQRDLRYGPDERNRLDLFAPARSRGLPLVGQSAGGTHVSGWLARQGCLPESAADVAGAVMLSGIFDFAIASPSPMHDAYLGTDRGLHAGRSTLAALTTTPVPCMFTIGELEPAQLQRQSAAVVADCHAARGRYPETIWSGTIIFPACCRWAARWTASVRCWRSSCGASRETGHEHCGPAR